MQVYTVLSILQSVTSIQTSAHGELSCLSSISIRETIVSLETIDLIHV